MHNHWWWHNLKVVALAVFSFLTLSGTVVFVYLKGTWLVPPKEGLTVLLPSHYWSSLMSLCSLLSGDAPIRILWPISDVCFRPANNDIGWLLFKTLIIGTQMNKIINGFIVFHILALSPEKKDQKYDITGVYIEGHRWHHSERSFHNISGNLSPTIDIHFNSIKKIFYWSQRKYKCCNSS